ncbi:hypothetical protein [Nocardioides convexus]|uniref:hypothetical protein n=1 Tax=Nocardioides convexus TaxID=2712224 RepID=UPI0024184FAB|nr:hypothetical protein [Nocardioides convexus]
MKNAQARAAQPRGHRRADPGDAVVRPGRDRHPGPAARTARRPGGHRVRHRRDHRDHRPDRHHDRHLRPPQARPCRSTWRSSSAWRSCC